MTPATVGSADLRYQHPVAERQLLIPARVAEQIEAEYLKAGSDETGGILLGRYVNGGLAEITAITTQQPGDEAGPKSFIRSVAHQPEIDKAWRSGLGCYLGEWHTHPGYTAVLSHTDIACLKAIANTPAYNCSDPVMVVVGLARISAHVCLNNKVQELEPMEEE